LWTGTLHNCVETTRAAAWRALPRAALEGVAALLGTSQKNGFVLSTTRGKRPFSGFSKAKHALNEKIDELPKKDKRKPMPHWVLHDLRRTARALCRAPRCRARFAERMLGHARKRDALDELAAFF
jgi:hypothetical protein